jgi:hypothetical protein
MKNKNFFIGLIVLVFFLGSTVGILAYTEIPRLFESSNSLDFTPNSIPNSQEEILNNCKNLDLFDTSECFKDNVKTFFKYTQSDIEVTFKDGKYQWKSVDGRITSYKPIEDSNFYLMSYLKENGGECEQWTLFYHELCQKTDFNCAEVSNGGVRGLFYAHRYLVMSNSTHYCKIDQTKLSCSEITWK